MPVDLSIIIPAYNEEDNLPELFRQIDSSLKPSGYSYEVILVNDGSNDNTWKTFTEIAADNQNYIGIDMRGNYGQSSALAAGIDLAKGKYIITMDGDLQNDPSDIPAMLEKLISEDWDLVAGIRANRKDGFILRKLPSKIANLFIRTFTKVKLKDYGCTLKVFKSDIAKELGLYGELHRFIPVLAHLQGARITDMTVKHHPRIHGKSKYGINRTFKVLSDLILMVFYKKYMQRPMHIFAKWGIIILGIGIIIDLYMLALKVYGHDIWGKPLLLLGILLTLGGIQLITTGILAEILMRTYYESQSKKPYSIRRFLHYAE